MVQLPALFCLRFPRLCAEIKMCAENPENCKRKICGIGRALYTGLCSVPGCKNPQESQTTIGFKFAAAESCAQLRELVGSSCYPNNRDIEHLRQIEVAKAKAKTCLDCFSRAIR